jgi:uncharacterized protein (DUF433 family)
MSTNSDYRYLEDRPCSLYRQPFIKGRRIRVEILYAATFDAVDVEEGLIEGQTPEEIAADYDLPVEAVREAIDYCKAHWDVVMKDHAREERIAEATGTNHPDYKYNPKKDYKILTPQELAAIFDDEPVPARRRGDGF